MKSKHLLSFLFCIFFVYEILKCLWNHLLLMIQLCCIMQSLWVFENHLLWSLFWKLVANIQVSIFYIYAAFEFQLKSHHQNNCWGGFFCERSWTKLYLPWKFPRQSSGVTSAMLFYLINHYKTIIHCLAKHVNNSK